LDTSVISTTEREGFSGLGLSESLHAGIAAAGYRQPTPVQREAIPHVVRGRDVLGCAQTGTGKTAAFALPIIERLLHAEPERRGRAAIAALILAPTRELAAQINDCFAQFTRGTGLRHAVIFGGVSQNAQIQALRRGVDILVATPGRLIDLMQQGEIDLSRVRIFVLDEADRMLDMGFIHDVRRVIARLPQKRQTLLLSATMPREIEALAARILVDPVRVEVDRVSSIGEPISQAVYFVEPSVKLRLLITLLEGDAIDRALVFTRTKRGANRVAEDLVRAGFHAAAIHGNKSQSARERALRGFKTGELRVVACTDLASRGIDIQDLSHVINYDMPQDPESYVHRIGRTGRAGKSGVALSFCTSAERPDLLAIERLSRLRIQQAQLPEQLASLAPRAGNAARSGHAPRPVGHAPRHAGHAPRPAIDAPAPAAGAPRASNAAPRPGNAAPRPSASRGRHFAPSRSTRRR
jgi:ATP-dependent RNA helicase RhlE